MMNLLTGKIRVAKNLKLDQKSEIFWRALGANISELGNLYVARKKRNISKRLLYGEKVQDELFDPEPFETNINSEYPDLNLDAHTVENPSNWNFVNPGDGLISDTPFVDNTVWAGITAGSNSGDAPLFAVNNDPQYITDSISSGSWTPGVIGPGPIVSNEPTWTTGTYITATKPLNGIVTFDMIYVNKKTRRITGEPTDGISINPCTLEVAIDRDVNNPWRLFYRALLDNFAFDDMFYYRYGLKEL